MAVINQVQDLLLNCENSGKTFTYSENEVKLDLRETDIYIISDLHIGEGIQKNFSYQGTENFFADSSFKRFIEHLIISKSFPNSTLIINGDFIDFIRIASYPVEDEDFAEWKNILSEIGITKSIDELKNSISDKEKIFGLKTDDYKSVWKLHRAITGHREVFDALTGWLNDGNRLIISKGNHDLELYWLAIRNYYRLFFAKNDFGSNLDIAKNLEKIIFPNLIFIDHSLLINEKFYIEHGHKYDRFTYSVGGCLLDNKKELNIPFGSFFNRYLLNRIELMYPYVDNVRPSQNILPMLLKEKFFVGLKFLFYHIPFLFLIIPKKYYKYMFQRVLTIALAIIIPIMFFVIGFWNYISPIFSSNSQQTSGGLLDKITQQGTNLLESFAMLFLSYLLARIVAYFQLEEPSTLSIFAKEVFSKKPGIEVVTFGHTHNPDQFDDDGKMFFNTGTWIPVVEASSADIRLDKAYIFFRVLIGADGNLKTSPLQRWNDDANRAEYLTLIFKD